MQSLAARPGELGTAYMAWSEIDAEDEKELRMSLRLYAAKMRRIDKAQAGKRHGSPFLELECIYKAELELTQAKVTRAEVKADANNVEANLLAQQCRVLSLENAKLRRLLRAHEHDRVCVCGVRKVRWGSDLGSTVEPVHSLWSCLVFWACRTDVPLHAIRLLHTVWVVLRVPWRS